MLIRPDRDDLRIIGFYLGKVLDGLTLVMALPLLVAVVRGDVNDVTALLLGMAVAVIAGRVAHWRLYTTRSLEWSHGLVVVALAWLLGPLVMAIPLYLAGHLRSLLDAWFEMLSGLTTTGMSLLQDLDHLSVAMNLLRHLTIFVGGQGIIVVVLTVMASAGAQIGTLYIGEGREERIQPSIVQTARFIYLVAGVYAVVGTGVLWVTGLVAGLTPGRALFHAVHLFMAAFDTGGFAPQSTSIAFYHSPLVEVVLVVLMVAGSLSFGLHHRLWRGPRRQVLANFELRTLAITMTMAIMVVVFGLARSGAHTGVVELFRKGVFMALSAHTGTGLTVTGPTTIITDWGLIAPAGLVFAMAIGGMASSTTGGIKAFRIGIITKSILRDIRRSVQPDAAVVLSTVSTTHRRALRDDMVRPAVTVTVLYLMTYMLGAVVMVYFGWPLDQAMYESTSAASNAGLSAGILSPDNPTVLKLMLMAQMWMGRLEFIAVFALFGYLAATVRGRL